MSNFAAEAEYNRMEEEKKKANSLQAKQQNDIMNQAMGTYMNNPGQGFTLYGDKDQQGNMIAELSQVGAMTGQNMIQTGQQQQDYYNSLQKRRNGEDAVAANMMAGRNRNLANVGRQFAGRGVAGGVAAAGMNTAQNTADLGINDQMQKNARQNDQDLFNYVKRNQKVTGEALAQGQDKGLAAGIDTDTGSGMFGTVICTELFHQGIISKETYLKDSVYGVILSEYDPYTYVGYMAWAPNVVPLMRRHKFVTKFAAFFAVPWANQMAGKSSLRGKFLLAVGVPVCRLLGKLVVKTSSRKLSHV